ncbi:MAG: hypothetical protein M3304_02300 [Actinomycetota bacterium]|nr:hypothetical protein [Actinomycetota bacterium]
MIVLGSRPERKVDVFLALALTTLVSSSGGRLAAAVIPGKLEGTVLLIGAVGLQASLAVAGAAEVAQRRFRRIGHDSAALEPSASAPRRLRPLNFSTRPAARADVALAAVAA